MSSKFGWSLPPGCSMNDIDPEPGPCQVCGQDCDGTCICPECPVCGTFGDPKCYAEHGLVRTPEQIESRAAYEAWMRSEPDFGPDYLDDDVDQDAAIDAQIEALRYDPSSNIDD